MLRKNTWYDIFTTILCTALEEEGRMAHLHWVPNPIWIWLSWFICSLESARKAYSFATEQVAPWLILKKGWIISCLFEDGIGIIWGLVPASRRVGRVSSARLWLKCGQQQHSSQPLGSCNERSGKAPTVINGFSLSSSFRLLLLPLV